MITSQFKMGLVTRKTNHMARGGFEPAQLSGRGGGGGAQFQSCGQGFNQ